MDELPTKETLTVEFKSDRKRLPDDDLVEAVVGMANSEGGVIYLGIEKDGAPSGLHQAHRDLAGLASMVANRIQPSLVVTVREVVGKGKTIAAIAVPKSQGAIYSTQRARTLRRRLRFDGEPEVVPFHPHDFPSRQAALGIFDLSAQTLPDLGPEALDPLERERLRRAITNYNGDKSLLKLNDDELDGALGMIDVVDGKRVPTITGLLLIGREPFIKSHVATHEVAFQVLDDLQVRVNEFYRWPLIRLFEQLEQHFRAWYTEQEVQVGMFRVPVPNVDRAVFREAVVNALVHRDYARLGAIHVQWNDKVLGISSPGGLVNGVTVKTLLTVQPKPRNPRLADAFKRIGLAERTGRGVDAIYRGVLRYGRPAPSYARTTEAAVVVDLNSDKADLEFLQLVLQQENETGQPLPLSTLHLLSTLRRHRRVDAAELAEAMGEVTVQDVKALLEHVVEAGLVEAHGVKKGRTYTLSAKLYGKLGQKVQYVRQTGLSSARQKALALTHVETHGTIKRDEVVELCGLNPNQATKLLAALVKNGQLIKHGEKRGSYYTKAG